MAGTFSFNFGKEKLRHPHPAVQAEINRKSLELRREIDAFSSELEYMFEASNCSMCGYFAALSLAIAVGQIGQREFDNDVVASECVLKLCGFCSVRLAEAQAAAEVKHAAVSWFPGSN